MKTLPKGSLSLAVGILAVAVFAVGILAVAVLAVRILAVIDLAVRILAVAFDFFDLVIAVPVPSAWQRRTSRCPPPESRAASLKSCARSDPGRTRKTGAG